jgi:hypothetical protein
MPGQVYSTTINTLIKHYRQDKDYGYKRIFSTLRPNYPVSLGGVKTAVRRLDQTGTLDRRQGGSVIR